MRLAGLSKGDRTYIKIDGKLYSAEYLGRGKFSKVFKVGNRAVYYTQGDCGKEVLAMFQRKRVMHLPEIVRHDDVEVRGKYYYVFSSPIYRNVTRKDRSAYESMMMIINLYGRFWDKLVNEVGLVAFNEMTGAEIMERFVEYVRKIPIVPRSIVQALEELVNVAINCGGDVVFDFHRRNFGVNEYGTLIFRDPIASEQKD
jgi:hypothetical protein